MFAALVLAPAYFATLTACLSAGPGEDTLTDTGAMAAAEALDVELIALEVDEVVGSLVHVTWEQSQAGAARVEYLVDHDWVASPERELPAGTHEQVLAGIPYGMRASVRVWVTGEDGEAESLAAPVETDPLPERIPQVHLLHADPGGWDPKHPFLLVSANVQDSNYGGPYVSFILDRAGRVVWSLQSPDDASTFWVRPSRDGRDLLIDHNTFWTLFDSSQSTVDRVKLDGSVVETIPTPGMAHAYEELPDGSFLWMYDDPQVQALMLRDPAGGIHKVWDCRAFFDALGAYDACGTNSITWDERTDSVLLSFFTSETVVQLAVRDWSVMSWFGSTPGGWTFTDERSQFYFQHGATFIDNGNLLVSSRNGPHGQETVAREYELDVRTRTLTQVWSFGEGEGVHADTLGEAHRLPDGNTLHNYGSDSRLREVTPDGLVVWDLAIGDVEQSIGRTVPLRDLYAFLP